MTLSMFISQLFFAIILIGSSYAAHLFYLSVNGVLRIILIWFFISLFWYFAIQDVYWLLWDFKLHGGVQPVWIRLVSGAPFVFMLVRLCVFMKGRK